MSDIGVNVVPLTPRLRTQPVALIGSGNSKRVAYARRRRLGRLELFISAGIGASDFIDTCDGLVANSMVFSSDSHRFACGIVVGRKQAILVDGEPGRLYSAIGNGNVAFSPDARRVAYSASDNKKCFYVIDECETEEYDAVLGPVVFSPDSNRVSYLARLGETHLVVTDGRVLGRFDGLSSDSPTFTADSKHVLYVARRGPKWLLCRDQDVLFEASDIVAVRFSPMGDRAIVVIRRSKGGELYHLSFSENSPGAEVNLVHRSDSFGLASLTWSRNGRYYGITAAAEGEYALILNGKRLGCYQGIADQPIAFSSDERRWAHPVGRYPHELVLSDTGETSAYSGILEGTPVFSPNSTRIAYGAERRDGTWMCVVDGSPHDSYPGIGQIVFGQDGRNIAYWADPKEAGYSMRLVVNAAPVSNVVLDGLVVGTKLASSSPDQFSALAWSARRINEINVTIT